MLLRLCATPRHVKAINNKRNNAKLNFLYAAKISLFQHATPDLFPWPKQQNNNRKNSIKKLPNSHEMKKSSANKKKRKTRGDNNVCALMHSQKRAAAASRSWRRSRHRQQHNKQHSIKAEKSIKIKSHNAAQRRVTSAEQQRNQHKKVCYKVKSTTSGRQRRRLTTSRA